MRVQSIFEVSTSQQQNPYVLQKVGAAATGKANLGITFEEYLKSYCQQANSPAATRQTERTAVGIHYAYPPRLKVPSKTDPTLKNSAI